MFNKRIGWVTFYKRCREEGIISLMKAISFTIDDLLIGDSNIKVKSIKSMTNERYKKNIKKVNDIIDRNNRYNNVALLRMIL